MKFLSDQLGRKETSEKLEIEVSESFGNINFLNHFQINLNTLLQELTAFLDSLDDQGQLVYPEFPVTPEYLVYQAAKVIEIFIKRKTLRFGFKT